MLFIVKHLLSSLSQWISIVGCQRHSKPPPQHKRKANHEPKTHEHIKKRAFWFRLYLSYGVSVVDIAAHMFGRAKNSIQNPGPLFCVSLNIEQMKTGYRTLHFVHIHTASQQYLLYLYLYFFFFLLLLNFHAVASIHSCSSNLLL